MKSLRGLKVPTSSLAGGAHEPAKNQRERRKHRQARPLNARERRATALLQDHRDVVDDLARQVHAQARVVQVFVVILPANRKLKRHALGTWKACGVLCLWVLCILNAFRWGVNANDDNLEPAMPLLSGCQAGWPNYGEVAQVVQVQGQALSAAPAIQLGK